MQLPTIYKAIAGGLVSAAAALLARFGFQVHAETLTAASVLVTGVVAYLGGHLFVYFAPSNKSKV